MTETKAGGIKTAESKNFIDETASTESKASSYEEVLKTLTKVFGF